MSRPVRNSPQQTLQLALELYQKGEFSKAEKLARGLLPGNRSNPSFLQFVAALCSAQSKFKDAVALCQQAVKLAPQSSEAHYNLGAALLGLERHAEALSSLQTSNALQSGQPDTLNNMGLALFYLDRLSEAEAALRQAVARTPHAQAHHNLGLVHQKRERYQEAIASFETALKLGHPDPAVVLHDVGHSLLALDREADAVKYLEASLRHRPRHAETLMRLADAYRILGRIDDTARCCEAGLAVEPSNMVMGALLLHVRRQGADWHDLDKLSRKVIRAVPDGTVSPFSALYMVDDPALQQTCAGRYSSKVAATHVVAPLPRRAPVRRNKIRVGYLSPDFNQHAVSRLTAGLFEQHDRSRFEILAFSYGRDDQSSLGRRVAKAFDRFLDVSDQPPMKLAESIHAHEVDIVVDLAGFTLRSRSAALARRPAPIQVNYLGYPGTMGSSWIDYIIVDRFVVPEGHEQYLTEKPVYMPDCFQVSDSNRQSAPIVRPTRTQCGLPEQAFVLCCFNNTYKLNPPLFDSWMRILKAAPHSVLWLVADTEEAKGRLRREAQGRGVDPDRILFTARVSHAEYLARMSLADLFLDTWPYNAGTTASDALRSNLPVLTCAGRSFVARMAGSLLQALGMPELITASANDYESLAVKLATDPAACGPIRSKLAERLPSAQLFDTARFCRHIETAYETMMQIWVGGEQPRHIDVQTTHQT
ncbi:MAG: tetratricopeptide repeat protein [Hyphomicrobiaceae bacterium]|nr:MAG: tetratricopeptide repeat protein [Hyphomicrobiaceae bacterium]